MKVVVHGIMRRRLAQEIIIEAADFIFVTKRMCWKPAAVTSSSSSYAFKLVMVCVFNIRMVIGCALAGGMIQKVV